MKEVSLRTRCAARSAITLALALIVAASAAAVARGDICSSDLPPARIFADLDGVWEGNFVGFDLAGNELYRVIVRQVYRTVDDNTQEVEIEDRQADGTIVHGRGHNVARCLEDGSLELRCRVTKSNGDRVEHEGRLASGADGRPLLIWSSAEPDRRESFLEAADTQHYTIDGVGIYGETVVVMQGRQQVAGGHCVADPGIKFDADGRVHAIGSLSPTSAKPQSCDANVAGRDALDLTSLFSHERLG